jgi:hypothetical protein
VLLREAFSDDICTDYHGCCSLLVSLPVARPHWQHVLIYRGAQALRQSLSTTFAVNDHVGPVLSSDALNALFEHCIKLAAENKITDRNVWQLDLISHLPELVVAGQATRTAAGFNFQKLSGGLDAGVTIYSKRVRIIRNGVLPCWSCSCHSACCIGSGGLCTGYCQPSFRP